MKRLSFLAALFGFGTAVKAQERTQDGPDRNSPSYKEGFSQGQAFIRRMMEHTHEAKSIDTDCEPPAGHATCPPINNKCPVCGRMAEPYTGPICLDNLCTVQGGYFSPKIVRCKRCNAAFWQDIETVR